MRLYHLARLVRARRRAAALLCLSLLALGLSRPWRMAAAQGGAGDPAPPSLSKPDAASVPGEILVRFRAGSAVAPKRARASLTLSAAGRALPVEVEDFGGSEIVEGLRLAHVEAGETEAAIKALNARPDVLYAEPNYVRRKSVAPNDPRYAEQWGLRNTGQSVGGSVGGAAGADVKAEQAWDVTRGSRSIVVGIVDEGVDISHPDLAPNVWTNPSDDADRGFPGDAHGWDFVHNDATVYDGTGSYPADATDAHGTHVAGIIGAAGDNGVGVSGVNWQVSLLPIKVLGPAGGTDADIIRGLAYAKMLRDLWASTSGARGANVRVLNNSYGGPGFSQSSLDAIRALNDSGILFVAAAGNAQSNADYVPQYPADYDAPNLISVAATTQFDALALFSNYGARKVALAAPGTSVLSTTPGNTYSFFSGTSMATPFVTGAAALLCAARPSITVSEARAALVFSGDPLPALAGKTYSVRRLNIAAALQSAAESDTTPPAQAASLTVEGAGRAKTLRWTAPGDDGNAGRASLYEINFTDAATGATFPLATQVPSAAGAQESAAVQIPYRHASGSVVVKTLDNAGNASSASVAVAVNAESEAYTATEGNAGQASSGGSPLHLNADDAYLRYDLPFGLNFGLFGRTYGTVYVSTNGALYFGQPPLDDAGRPADAISSVNELNGLTMIAGLWDDLRTDRRAGDDVYVSQPSPDKIIFRWQAVTYDTLLPDGTRRGENPVNFEIELDRGGPVFIRYGDGNQNVLPVVGVGGGEPEAYVSASHTSEYGRAPVSLANAPSVSFRPHTFAITGHVTGATQFVQIKLTGTGGRDFTNNLDAGGNYAFYNLPAGGDYTITPVTTNNLYQYIITPPSRTFTNLDADQTADFNVSIKGYTVRGRVVDGDGNGVAGICILNAVVPGAQCGAQTDAGGTYTFANLPAGQSYMFSPSSRDYTFTPAFRTVDTLSADTTLADIVARRLFNVSGRVVDSAGKGLSGVSVNSGAPDFRTATTDANGNYTLNQLIGGGTVTVTPSLPGYGFTPPGQTFVLDSTRTLPDFVGRRLFLVQGVVRDQSGNGINAVTVTLSGSGSATTQTSANGSYSLGALPEGGTYTVKVSKPFYTFDQPSVTFANLSAQQTSTNFIGTLAANTIQGRVTDAASRPVASITLTLSGASSATTQTDSAGFYVFGDLSTGATYIVTPATDAYTFSPASLTFDNFAGNVRNANFTGTPKGGLRIDGTIDDGNGHGVASIPVNLTGPVNQFGVPLSLSTTTDAAGQFSFANLTAGANYTVSPLGDAFDGFNPSSVNVTLNGNATVHFTATGLRAQPSSIQFSIANPGVAENAGGGIMLSVVRAGDTSSAASVDYATVDDPSPIRCDDTATKPGVAFARCDYATTVGTVTFAPGQNFKTIFVPIIDDSFVEPQETFKVRLSNAQGAPLGAISTATVNIVDNDVPGILNPITFNDFFVRMQYLDFLSRDPEPGQPWSNVLAQCRPGDTTCDRVAVSSAFFRSQEFQLKGLFVFKFYRASFGRLPLYSEIIPDMAAVTGTTTAELVAKKGAFTDAWVGRQEFKNLYDSMTNRQFVDALLSRYSLQSITAPDPAAPDGATKITLTRSDLVNRLGGGTLTRAQVVRAVADSNEVGAAEYNAAFVAMQYFGYLRRDPEPQGYADWLATINANPDDVRSMVNGFVNSTEYRLRFGRP